MQVVEQLQELYARHSELEQEYADLEDRYEQVQGEAACERATHTHTHSKRASACASAENTKKQQETERDVCLSVCPSNAYCIRRWACGCARLWTALSGRRVLKELS